MPSAHKTMEGCTKVIKLFIIPYVGMIVYYIIFSVLYTKNIHVGIVSRVGQADTLFTPVSWRTGVLLILLKQTIKKTIPCRIET